MQSKWKSVKLDIISWLIDIKCNVRLAYSSICTVYDKGKGRAISVLVYCRPERVPGGWGSQIYRQLAHEGGWFVGPMYCPPLPPKNIPGTYFFQGLNWPWGHSGACWIMLMKNFNDTIWNWTRNQLAAQSEQTAPLCASQFMIMLIELNTVLCVEVMCLCNKPTTSLWEWTMSKTMVSSILHSCCIRNK